MGGVVGLIPCSALKKRRGTKQRTRATQLLPVVLSLGSVGIQRLPKGIHDLPVPVAVPACFAGVRGLWRRPTQLISFVSRGNDLALPVRQIR